MSKIAIVTDSTADLMENLVERYDIKVLPLQVIYAQKIFRDRVDITPSQVYKDMDREVPKTSLPLTADVVRTFEKLRDEGYTHIIGIFISTGLSGTYNMVRNMVADYAEDFTIELIDSKTLSWGMGYGVIAAAQEVEASGDFEKALEKAKTTIANTRSMFVIPTLYYLKKGGRMGRVEGTVGDLLDIKPIVGIDEAGDGKYFTLRKARGKKKSYQAIFDVAAGLVKDAAHFKITVLHGEALEQAEKFAEEFSAMANCDQVQITEVSPVIGVHTGPGLLAFSVTSEEGLPPWKKE